MKYVLAEDFPSVVFFLKHLLVERIGVDPKDIESVGNSDDLLSLVGKEEYRNAFLLLDLSMPGRYRRLVLVKELFRRNTSLKIVVYTAYHSAHLAKDLLQQGIAAYVTKGSSPDVLITATRAGLSGKSSPTRA
ncbi:response regulator [Lysobacter enzymogenes]|uniref:response regulator n=1 Tax=Lysobacter enzymogenes TaxID=69 RepID=UPI002264FBAF|nr:response regulator transcription factor [Lysobacter enzymogenes]UZW61886.1 response regulator transcription factor [Lysobacter enzymogenes]